MNFVLALLCLAGAVALFGYQAYTGDRRYYFRGTDISMGWLILLMAVYNVARWWSVRASQSSREAERAAQAERIRQRSRSYRPPPPVTDPIFDFSNPAPPEEGSGVEATPPPNPLPETERGGKTPSGSPPGGSENGTKPGPG